MSAAALVPKYFIDFKNQDGQPWKFYLFLKDEVEREQRTYGIVAWYVSPKLVDTDSVHHFVWEEDYNFTWGVPGILSTGAVYQQRGLKPANPNAKNQTTFRILNENPEFTNPEPGGPLGFLKILIDRSVPGTPSSIGSGISGSACTIFSCTNGLTNVASIGISTGKHYSVGVSKDIKVGQVLEDKLEKTVQLNFPPNKKKATVVYGGDNKWNIEYS